MSLAVRAYYNAFTLWHSRAESRLPYWRRERLLEVQSRRVQSIVAHAYRHVPHYRDVMDERGLAPADFRTADDLARLPLVGGEDLARAPHRFRSANLARKDVLELYTTGTSGHAKHVAYDRAAVFLALAHGHRQRVVSRHFTGRLFGYREMQFDRDGGVSSRMRDFVERNSWVPPGIDYSRSRLPTTESLRNSIARINAFRPDVLAGVGSCIGAVFRHAWQHGVGLHRPKLVRFGGTVMPAADRALIEREFGVPVRSSYQAVEALRLAFECEHDDGLHVHVDSVAIRAIDRAGRTLGPGQTGDLILSNLVNRGTVLLNYRLGDVVTLAETDCRCGRTLPLLRAVEGRSGDLLRLPGGDGIYPNSVIAAASVVPGFVQAQLRQDDERHLTLRIVADDDPDWDAARRAVEAVVRPLIGPEMRLEVERVAAIPCEPSGKVRSFVGLRG